MLADARMLLGLTAQGLGLLGLAFEGAGFMGLALWGGGEVEGVGFRASQGLRCSKCSCSLDASKNLSRV